MGTYNAAAVNGIALNGSWMSLLAILRESDGRERMWEVGRGGLMVNRWQVRSAPTTAAVVVTVVVVVVVTVVVVVVVTVVVSVVVTVVVSVVVSAFVSEFAFALVT